jgi:outer membrane protein OmpA-like peptidoglycan-associated protein
MASKKYFLLTCALFLLASYGFSQQTTTPSGTGYDASDSSIIPARSMPQHTEFMNGTYNYPAKPRNQWEVGIKAGYFTINGDVATLPSYGVGAHIRRAFGYLFSARLSYMQGIGRGLNWKPSSGYRNNPAWFDRYNSAIAPVPNNSVYYNYRTVVHDVSLEGIFTLNNIRFHKSKSGFNVYALAGLGGAIYDAKVNALNNGDNTVSNPFDPALRYPFNNISGSGVYKNRKDTRKALRDLLDDSYETQAEEHGTDPNFTKARIGGSTLIPVYHIGLGFAFKLNNRFNLALEDRFTITKDDLLDGQQWAEQSNAVSQAQYFPVMTRDFDTYNHLTLGLNMNLGAKATEPLWWMNPLDYAYSEIRNPRLMRLPKPVLPDTDGDGITDQFDQEQTPSGVPVDSHGVSRDTDGDGVPDARDKELVTPTYCQPVDADGVGKCPCPEGCGVAKGDTACANALGALPSITFTGNTARLSTDAQGLLASVAGRLRNSPECRIVVTGYCASTKAEQQRSWDRVNTIINYLVEREGISQDRLVFVYAQEGGDCNTVDLRAATAEDQPTNNVPAPHPNLRRR